MSIADDLAFCATMVYSASWSRAALGMVSVCVTPSLVMTKPSLFMMSLPSFSQRHLSNGLLSVHVKLTVSFSMHSWFWSGTTTSTGASGKHRHQTFKIRRYRKSCFQMSSFCMHLASRKSWFSASPVSLKAGDIYNEPSRWKKTNITLVCILYVNYM